MLELLVGDGAIQIIITGLLVGVVVGITGMGGGALMTPALIFLGVGNASTVVTADVTAAAVSKTGGAVVHWRKGAPNLKLAGWLIAGSVPFALLGPNLVHWWAGGEQASIEKMLKMFIGFALLLAAATYAARLWINLVRIRRGTHEENDDPKIRPIPTMLVGAVGGLLVGITSVGSGSVIMVALLMLYPGLSPLKLVGTDLVQAVPLVLAAAISNIALNGLELQILIPLLIGSVPGTILGARIAPHVPTSWVRRGIIVVLTMSGVALLDKAGWAPLGAGENETYPMLVLGVGVALLVLVPVIWGVIRRRVGLPMFGAPTVADLEQTSKQHRARAQSTSGEDRD